MASISWLGLIQVFLSLDPDVSDEVFWVSLVVVISDKLPEYPAPVTYHAVTALEVRVLAGVRLAPRLKTGRLVKSSGKLGKVNFP